VPHDPTPSSPLSGSDAPTPARPPSDVISRLHAHLSAQCTTGKLGAVAVVIIHKKCLVDRWATGWVNQPGASEPVADGTRFLVASITKPVTAAATMRLVEDGEIALTTPIVDVLPEFGGDGRNAIELWHLLTHTSGLPDMVANNERLRQSHAGLCAFYQQLCQTPLLFAPGTAIGYQSMGSLVMAMLIERVSTLPFRTFVSREIFLPAGMMNSHLGLAEEDDGGGDVQVDLPAGQRESDWHWNSRYWRTLGAPWGGLVTTATDLGAFLQLFLNEGRSARGGRVLAPETVTAMRRDWTGILNEDFPAVGLGFMVKGHPKPHISAASNPESAELPDPTLVRASPNVVYDRSYFGDLMSYRAFGHTGVTGCAMLADPARDVAAVIVTSAPAARWNGTIPLFADMVAASTER
jgi:CubicO group peptidase (beta-lactamase class C family)